MNLYQVEIPPHVAGVLRRLPPDIKKSVREAIRALSQNPAMGEPLRGELEGLWKYRVRRYRIVYEVDRQRRRILLYAIGHRREVYAKISR